MKKDEEISLLKLFPEVAAEWHPTKNGDLSPENVSYGSNKDVWWKCNECDYEWHSKVGNRTSYHRGCPKCGRKRGGVKYSVTMAKKNGCFAEAYPELISEWDYDKNGALVPELYSIHSQKKVWWKCKNGHSWETSIANRTNGTQCPYCSGNKIMQGFNDLETLRPDLLKEWDYEKNIISPKTVGIGYQKKVWWKCNKGHSFDCTVRSRVIGVGCRYCAHQDVIEGENDFATLYPEMLKEWDFDKNKDVDPHKVFPQTSLKVWWKCPLGHSYIQTMNHKVGRNQTCPQCSREIKTSFPEQAILFYLKLPFSDAISGFSDYGFELDVFVPSIMTAIEYDGVHWHTNNHTTVTESLKNKRCKELGIRLIRVREPGLDKNIGIDCEIIERSDFNTDASLDKAICDILTLLSITDYDVNVYRDRIRIYNEYIKIRKKRNLAITHPEIAAEWNYAKNGELIPEIFVGNTNKKVWWKCKKGHEWQAGIIHRTSRNDGCPYCGNRKVLTGYNDVATTNPELISEWDYIKNTISPQEIIPGSPKRVWWICPQGHSYDKPVRERTGMKRKSSCPICESEKRSESAFIAQVAAISPSIEIIGQYSGTENKIVCKCKRCGHVWEGRAGNLKRGTGCPNCRNRKEVRNTTLGINYINTEEAAKAVGCSVNSLRAACQQHKRLKGYFWEYLK